ncbi:hypothetical protein DS884_00305 [Tenacibaculum sp. E3R01]|nr:hypothetical protein DS884_00305 [Tenacibaculum sp. E3R01]
MEYKTSKHRVIRIIKTITRVTNIKTQILKLKSRIKFKKWNKYLFEFLSIFLAVTLAFLLDRWNDERKNNIAENKILKEIYNGLERDSIDIANDEQYFKVAFRGLNYFSDIIDGKTIKNDSLVMFYYLFSRESIVVQNKSGYESLKSKGLETIKSDSLRSKIINLYEVDYELARKFNEEHSEYKFMPNYFHRINQFIAPNFKYDTTYKLVGIKLPLVLKKTERNLLKSYLWKIGVGKSDRYRASQNRKKKIGNLRKEIKEYLNTRNE